MKRIGTTTNGNIIAEIAPDEWREMIGGIKGAFVSLSADMKNYRKAHGMSQQHMADKAKVSRNYISQIERGEALNLSLDVYQRILDVITDEV